LTSGQRYDLLESDFGLDLRASRPWDASSILESKPARVGLPRIVLHGMERTGMPRHMSRPLRSALSLGLALTATFVIALAPRHAPAQQTQAAPGSAGSNALPTLTTEVAFPNVKFIRPVALAYPEDGSHLLFVVEQHTATIYSFPNDKDTKDKQEFLKLPDPINRGNEEGLLGLAFHPRYKQNGQFFVYYSANDMGTRHSVVSRFRVSLDDQRKADPGSKERVKANPGSEERVWVSDKDPFENHNGGCIAFGPDGYLYISLGDGGAGGDPHKTGQDPTDWFASLLRIDVDHPSDGKAYGIPADNPTRRSQAFAHWAPEVYCIGLRNVWKFTFDRANGTLWAGDVGQNEYEMVHILQNGGNYGWSIREAFHPFEPRRRLKADPSSPITPPLVEYPHKPTHERPDDGKSITGGYVYRGKALPELVGVYVYGDFDTGRIWGLREQDGKAIVNGELIDRKREKKLSIAAFGEDPEGELFILAFDGQIHRLARRSGASR
jgi:glucose/arabinose dehydrogenase